MGWLGDDVRQLLERCRDRAESDPALRAHIEAAEAEERERAVAHGKAVRESRMAKAGIPEPLWPVLEAPDGTDALVAVRRFLAAPRACVFLLLLGPRGRGKTFAAAWAVAQHGGLAHTAQGLVAAGSFASIWSELAEAEVAVVDELGAEHVNDAYLASLYSLLDRRHAHQWKTILISNLDPSGFKARYGSGGMERLLERLVTAGEVVTLPGESMRRKWSET